ASLVTSFVGFLRTHDEAGGARGASRRASGAGDGALHTERPTRGRSLDAAGHPRRALPRAAATAIAAAAPRSARAITRPIRSASGIASQPPWLYGADRPPGCPAASPPSTHSCTLYTDTSSALASSQMRRVDGSARGSSPSPAAYARSNRVANAAAASTTRPAISGVARRR